MSVVLYSFRRCPYAIRARYTLDMLQVRVQLREVVLKNKPQALLDLGGRSTVPQLVTQDERYPESLDIIFWALRATQDQTTAQQLWPQSATTQAKIRTWLSYNDHCFKPWLDRYKYADRHPEHPQSYYRQQGERFLQRLEQRLTAQTYLMGQKVSLADIGVFPFIRQFAGVDHAWFEQAPYPKLRAWLEGFMSNERFARVMQKFPAWDASQAVVYFP
ncbi:glutathione S-transferase [Marinomonas ostreistagni]|uniref:glutathione S-transferase n=1 Tax=Marinomonas ostreistagni TaxID=359209 RepID=UPI00194DE269|nr:glutathione S-transferase [Marinomonas ostreistagni]MBM6549470.1 glutathione S-transferase [Marinomonas ostreistagni]